LTWRGNNANIVVPQPACLPLLWTYAMFSFPDRRSNKTQICTWLRFLAALISVGLVAPRPIQATDPTTVAVLKRVEAKSRTVASHVLGATVGILNQSLATDGRLGEGSGVVVSDDGLILTAGHVLAKPGSDLTVIFPDGRRASAKALGANFARDSGLAKITDAGKWPHVEMGHSDDIKPGTWCMALGHPGGIQQGRTPPIRLGRVLNSGKGSRFLVTDATIISGDSGGPLFDLEGRVIGIHSNIGTNVNQNQHVPIDVYREQWNDLLAGKSIGTPADLHANNMPDPAKVKKFRDLMVQRLLAGDPEVRELLKGGHLNITPDEMDRLIAKWEKTATAGKADTPVPAGSAATKPLDFLKFQRLFQDRLLAGDPEVLRLIKNGTMMVTPDQMHQLMEQWERKALAANSPGSKPGETMGEKPPAKPLPNPNQAQSPKPAPSQTADSDKAKTDRLAKLREMMKAAESLGEDENRLRVVPESTRDFPGLFGVLRGNGHGARVDYRKSNPTLLQDLAAIAAQASRSTVLILCDGRAATLGTVVRNDGYIVTKASEVHGKLVCRIGSRELPATVVKSNADQDLALLKVDAKDLVPIAWADGEPPVPGSWLLTPAPDQDILGLGVVSIAARAIPDAPKILLRNRAIVGVMLDPAAKDARVREVRPDLPAAKAGLKAGDVILNVNGQKTPTLIDVNQALSKYKPGDMVTVDITRAGKTIKLKMDLVSSDAMAPKISGDQLTHLSEAGGTVSKRHNKFASALTHDTVLQATQCGGPVVDLDGRAIGLNIARADRTASYAVPAGTIRKEIAELLAGVK
jgi:serine protease Do